MTTPQSATAGRDVRPQLRLIHAAAEHLMTEDFEELSRSMVLEMTLDMLGAVIEGRDLEPTADYVAHYCDVIDSRTKAEQIAAQIEAALEGGASS